MLPTFSPQGWITNPIEIADYLLAHFFETQKSQTHFFKGNISSYQSLIADHFDDNDTYKLKEELEYYLTNYFNTQFENSEISVTIEPKSPDDDSKLAVRVNCTFNHKGLPYSLDRVIEFLGINFKRIDRLEHTGSPE